MTCETAGCRSSGGLDLAGLHPEPADLDLDVGAAEEPSAPPGQPPYDVAGAVHPAAGAAPRVGHELLGGQVGPAQVAAGHPGPGDDEFAGHAERRRAEGVVEDVHAGVVDGRPDRHPGAGQPEAGLHREQGW